MPKYTSSYLQYNIILLYTTIYPQLKKSPIHSLSISLSFSQIFALYHVENFHFIMKIFTSRDFIIHVDALETIFLPFSPQLLSLSLSFTHEAEGRQHEGWRRKRKRMGSEKLKLFQNIF